MKIKFLGACDGVTGSNYLLEAGNKKILIDCGLYQGPDEVEKKNWADFDFNISDIDLVIITHSHIDHVGRLPKLIKDGYRGPIYMTPATRDFTEIFLADSAEILGNYAENHHLEKLYEQSDVDKTIELIKPIDYHQTFKTEDLAFTFYDAGHILGSAFVKIESQGKSIVFSGDLGNPPVPIIKDTEFIQDIDYLICESTYGDRLHDPANKREDELEDAIEEAYTKKGTILIPAFAMERTQELLYELNYLVTNNKIPQIPIYIDSPLAIKATKIYPKYSKDFDKEAKAMIASGKKLFEFPGLKMTASPEESKKLERDHSQKIIIAGSGMSTGGRILYHEMAYLSDPKTTMLIVGYQVQGTLGRKLQDGVRNVNIKGRNIAVNAKIITLNSYSAHADQAKLVWWIRKINHRSLDKIFLVHGEDESKQALRTKIQDDLAINTYIPKENEEIEL